MVRAHYFAALVTIVLALAQTAAGAYSQPNSTIEAPVYVINLDLAPSERWTELVTIYKSSAPALIDYFTSQLPAPVTKLLEIIMGNLDSLLGDYGVEMRGVAKAFGIDLGVIVGLNFAYELRKWGGGRPNITAPYTPQVCTSIVAEDEQHNIFHGRNMDWNLPLNLRNLTVQLEFQRSGKTVYVGATYVGFVGLFTAMLPGRYSVSINERDIGGSPVVDALTAILNGATSVTHILRQTMDRAHTYEDAVQILKTTVLSAPVYYISAGTKANEGIVITRDRDITRNAWTLPDTTGQPWYLLQTNYDHWLPDPPRDARRTYGDTFMNTIGQATGSTIDGIFSVLSTWPVMNNHTCQTVMMQPATGYMRSYGRYFYNATRAH